MCLQETEQQTRWLEIIQYFLHILRVKLCVSVKYIPRRIINQMQAEKVTEYPTEVDSELKLWLTVSFSMAKVYM